MNKEIKEPEKGKNMSTIITVCAIVMVVVIGALVFVTTVDFMHDYAIDHAQDTIDNMQNVSDDYRQGWNDCLVDIDANYNKAQNMTSAVADNCI